MQPPKGYFTLQVAKIEQTSQRQTNKKLDCLGFDKGAFAFGEEGEGGVSVLNKEVCKQYAKGGCTGSVEGDKDEVRTRFWDQPNERGKEEDEVAVLSNPFI